MVVAKSSALRDWDRLEAQSHLRAAYPALLGYKARAGIHDAMAERRANSGVASGAQGA